MVLGYQGENKYFWVGERPYPTIAHGFKQVPSSSLSFGLPVEEKQLEWFMDHVLLAWVALNSFNYSRQGIGLILAKPCGSGGRFLLVTDFVFQCLGGTLVGWWVSSLGLPFILVFCWPLFWSLGLLIILIVYFIIIFNNQRAFVSSLWTCLVFLVLLILFIIKYSICWFFF